MCHNTRNGAAFSGGGKSNNWLSSNTHRSAAAEVDLTTYARVKLVANGVGYHLASEIDFNSTINRNHIVISSNISWRIYILTWVKLYMRVVVYKIVKGLSANTKTGDSFVLMKGFQTIINNAFEH